jgi:hypothetical protein
MSSNDKNAGAKDNSGGTSSIIDLLKALIWPLATIILFTCHNSPIRGIAEGISRRMNDSTSDVDLDIKGVKAKFSRAIKAEETLTSHDTANQIPAKGEKLTQKSTAVPTTEVAKEAKILSDPSINRTTRFWVYLGQKINGKLMNSHFIISDLPVPGQRIVAKDAVYRRETFPVLLNNEEYQLGKSIGVVDGNEAVTVVEVRPITDDNNYWALVE